MTTTYCACGKCNTVIFVDDVQQIPAAELVENYVYKLGELNYIELFVKGHNTRPVNGPKPWDRTDREAFEAERGHAWDGEARSDYYAQFAA